MILTLSFIELTCKKDVAPGIIPRSKCRAALIVDKNCGFISVPCIFSAVVFHSFLNAVYFVFNYFLGKIFSRSFIRTPAPAISPKKIRKICFTEFDTEFFQVCFIFRMRLNYSLCFNFRSVRIYISDQVEKNLLNRLNIA